MTDRRSHGHGVPRLPDSAITPSRIPTLGSAENVALETITRFIFVRSIPMARPALHARMRNTMQISATKATIPPQIAYIAGLFSCDKIDMANFPFLFLLRPV